MDKDKDYLFWFSFGFFYYSFFQRFVYSILYKIIILPFDSDSKINLGFLQSLIKISEIDTIYLIRSLQGIFFPLIVVFIIKYMFRDDGDYFFQPLSFTMGVFIANIFWSFYLYIVFNDFTFFELIETVIPSSMIFLSNEILLVFAIFNGIAFNKKFIHIILAIAFQILPLIKSDFVNKNYINPNLPIDNTIFLWIVGFVFLLIDIPYILLSKRFYDRLDYFDE